MDWTDIVAAIRIAQQLGIHRLGNDPTTMPMPDPALPNTVCTLRREIPIRLLHALLFMSYMSMRVQSSLPPDLVNCSLPGNFNDVDLTQCGGIIIPQPMDVVTDSSFEVRTFSFSLES